jgi:NCAIR mutase (PurE)-related protein
MANDMREQMNYTNLEELEKLILKKIILNLNAAAQMAVDRQTRETIHELVRQEVRNEATIVEIVSKEIGKQLQRFVFVIAKPEA